MLDPKNKTRINEYILSHHHSESINVETLDGTDFQKKVWRMLTKIPYGKVYSYKDIAELTGDIKACRSVGMANSKNPLPIVIPCHRVVNSNKSLGGFSCGLKIKQKLLNLEKAIV